MTDEATTDTGSLEAATDAIREARQTAASPQEDGNKQQDEPSGATPATQERPKETPAPEEASGDEVDQQDADAGEEPNIKAPAWYTAAEKEWFAAQSPELQDQILSRDRGRQQAEHRRQTEHQAAIREAQEAAQAAAQDRQYFASAIQHYKHPIVAAFQQEFADVAQGRTDLFRLAQDTERWGRYQAFQAEFQRIGQAEQQLAHRAEQEEGSRLQQHIETRNSQLLDARPELKDPAKFQEFDNNVTGYLRGLNIPDYRIARVSYEELTIVEKAMKWDRAQKAKASASTQPAQNVKPGQTMVASHIRSVPKMLKPGTAGNTGATDDKITAIAQRARQSGKVDDAAERLRHMRMNLGRA